MNRTTYACITTAIITLVVSHFLTTGMQSKALAGTDYSSNTLKITDAKLDGSSIVNPLAFSIPKDWRLVSVNTGMEADPWFSVLWFTDSKGNVYKTYGSGKWANFELHDQVTRIPVSE